MIRQNTSKIRLTSWLLLTKDVLIKKLLINQIFFKKVMKAARIAQELMNVIGEEKVNEFLDFVLGKQLENTTSVEVVPKWIDFIDSN